MKQIPDLSDFLKGFHPDWFINCQLTFQVCDRPNNLCMNQHIVQPLENFMINVVYNQNLVSVSATETNIRFRYWQEFRREGWTETAIILCKLNKCL